MRALELKRLLPQLLPPRGLSGRQPAHPGHYLRTRFLEPAGLNQGELAEQLGISRRRVNEVLCGRRAVSPDTALRLALRFDTDPQLWSAWQAVWDLHRAWRDLRKSATSATSTVIPAQAGIQETVRTGHRPAPV